MSLDKTRLGNALADAVLAESGLSPVSADDTSLRNLMIALADEIIKEFAANADVAPGSFIDAEARPITGTGGPVS